MSQHRHSAPPDPGIPETRHPRRWLAGLVVSFLAVFGLMGATYAATSGDASWSSRLGAEGATIDAQISGLQQQIDALNGQLATVSGERDQLILNNNDLTAQVATLQAEVDRLKQYEPTPSPTPSPSPSTPTPTPTTAAPSMLVGSSLYRGTTGETSQQAYQRRCTDWGVCPEIVRYFFSGLPTTWQQFGNSVEVASFKVPSMSGFAAGNNDATIKTFFDSIPADGRNHYVALFHEPEDDIEAGHFTSAQFRAGVQHLQQLAATYIGSGKRIKVGVVLMSWSLDSRSGRNVDNYLVPGLGFIGWDAYPTLSAADIQTRYGVSAAKCNSTGVAKCFLTETAPNSSTGATQAQKASFIATSTSSARADGFDGYMYFDSTVGGDFRLTDPVTWGAIATEIRR